MAEKMTSTARWQPSQFSLTEEQRVRRDCFFLSDLTALTKQTTVFKSLFLPGPPFIPVRKSYTSKAHCKHSHVSKEVPAYLNRCLITKIMNISSSILLWHNGTLVYTYMNIYLMSTTDETRLLKSSCQWNPY